MKNKSRLIIVGGFLGAGKTTLLYETTRLLMAQGKKVGLVTNDQASELVDTAFLLQTKVNVAEVSGSCFCCNFNSFVDSLHEVENRSEADVLIAEPVGSCTDLSATIMQPLKDHYNNELRLAPLTVLADPFRLENILDGGTAGLHKSAAYIFKKQLEESDVIVITKTDMIALDKLQFLMEKVKAFFPHSKVMALSSRSGEGINEWLNFITQNVRAGNKIVEVDYDVYAEGEAVLGWLNASITLKGRQVNWDDFASRFLKHIGRKIDKSQASVGHIKLILQSEQNYLIGNITGNEGTMEIRGNVAVSDKAQLIVNARVGLGPDELDTLVRDTLTTVAKDNISLEINAWKCLSPGYPNPTYRYKAVV